MENQKKKFKAIIIILAAVLGLLLVVIFLRVFTYYQAEKEYEEISKISEEVPVVQGVVEETKPEIAKLNQKLEGQKEVNEDIIGWITLEDSKIDYPIVKGENNEYYMNHTVLGTENPAGAIFMETLNKDDFSDIVTFVYGHRMKDGSMFGNLKHYTDKEYWEVHREFQISTYQDNRIYEIFSVHRADVTDSTFQIFFEAGEEYERYLQEQKNVSFYETGVNVSKEDQIVILVTCAYDVQTERIVVLGKLKECESVFN